VTEFADGKESKRETLDFMGLSGDIWQALEKFDEHVKQYHLGLQDPSLSHFREAIQLLTELIRGIVKPISGWQPKFTAGSTVAWIVALSAAGSLRSLLASYKLLIGGYFMEAHASLRMVEQWAELSVIIEANPSLANKVLKKGVKEEYIKSACNKSPEFNKLLKAMDKTFSNLSQRGHVTKTAIQFVAPSVGNDAMELTLAGNASDKMLRTDGLALAGMAMNVLKVLRRHFKTVPLDWHSRLISTDKLIEELKSIPPPPQSPA
jgi:hypothetical protein